MMRNLSSGCTGTDVKNLQLALNSQPPSDLPPLAPDGIFGPKTLARVKEYQANNGLAADGIVGPKTFAALSGAGLKPRSCGCNCCNGESFTAGQAGATAALFQADRSPAGNQFGFAPVGFSSASSLAPASGGAAAPAATGSFRPLDAAQQSTAAGVYGSSLDFSTIFISDKTGLGNRPFTVAVPIQGTFVQIMNCGTFSPKTSTLIHELGHVWQSQHHSNKLHYMANAVKSQAAAVAANLSEAITNPFIALNKDFPAFFPFDAYAYHPSTPFLLLAAEQMAAAIENGEAAIVAHVKSIGKNALDPLCVSALSSPRISDHRLPGVK